MEQVTKTDSLEEALIGWKELRPQIGGHSWSTVWQWEKDKKFPHRVKIGRRCVWIRSQVLQWIREQIETQ